MSSVATSRTARPMKTGTEWLRSQVRQVGDGEPLAVDTSIAAAVEVEAWLQSRHARYAPPALIPMGLIDEKRSRGNQARREPIVAESVDRFTTAMKNGVPFPPIVVYPLAGKLVIIDGNNRQAAARKASLDSILGIVVAEDTPSELVHLLTVEANARHGVTPELSWRIQQAFGLCGMGWNDSDAADAAGLSLAQLRTARSVQDADSRARALRITGFASLPSSNKVALGAVRDEAVFTRLARVAVDTGMTGDDIRDVTRALRSMSSEAARIEYIANFAKARTAQRTIKREAGKHSRIHSPKMALAAGIGKLLSVDPTALAMQVVTGPDREGMLSRIGEAKKRLALLEVALRTDEV